MGRGAQTFMEKALSAPSSFSANQKTVAATATPEQLVGVSTRVGQGVNIKALLTNTQPVYVQSASDVDGYPLDTGQEVFVAVNDLSLIWIRVAVAGEGVAYSTV